jgi:hypothetical protein
VQRCAALSSSLDPSAFSLEMIKHHSIIGYPRGLGFQTLVDLNDPAIHIHYRPG